MARSLPLGLALLALPALSQAGSVMLPGVTGGNYQIHVRSMKDKHFRSTVHQKYDFSCGSAALATLLTNKGFTHFVVVKGVTTKEVLVGAPALGAKIYPRAGFAPMWNVILFLIRSNRNLASNHFNKVQEWRSSDKAPLGTAL